MERLVCGRYSESCVCVRHENVEGQKDCVAWEKKHMSRPIINVRRHSERYKTKLTVPTLSFISPKIQEHTLELRHIPSFFPRLLTLTHIFGYQLPPIVNSLVPQHLPHHIRQV